MWEYGSVWTYPDRPRKAQVDELRLESYGCWRIENNREINDQDRLQLVYNYLPEFERMQVIVRYHL
jgi:hypothetical protein